MTTQQILDEVRKLPQDERFTVAMDVWGIVEADAAPLSPELRAELDRRIVEDDADHSSPEDRHAARDRLLRGEL